MGDYPKVPLIDGDVLAYRAAFAVKDDEAENNARYTVKRVLENVIDKFDRGLEYRLFLTGKGNYRELVAKEQGYKANRINQPKPKYLPIIREYMQEWWRAEMIEGKEADDALGCAQTKETCIVTIDKDLLQCPGAHYNPVKDVYFEVTEEEGWRSFFTQCLVGDRVDNIRGIDGIGPVKAKKLLEECKGRMEMERAVIQAYVKEYGKRLGYQLLEERGALLWIQREPGKIWSPS